MLFLRQSFFDKVNPLFAHKRVFSQHSKNKVTCEAFWQIAVDCLKRLA